MPPPYECHTSKRCNIQLQQYEANHFSNSLNDKCNKKIRQTFKILPITLQISWLDITLSSCITKEDLEWKTQQTLNYTEVFDNFYAKHVSSSLY